MAPPNSPRGVPTPGAQPGSTYASIAATIPIGSGDAHLTSTDASTPSQTAQQKASDFVQAAIRRWRVCDQSESALRQAMRKDLEFYASDQWNETIKKQRDLDGRPCLTINRLPGFVRQVVNECRESRPGIEIDPVDNGADVDLAEVYMGLIQHIEANSDADVAYSTAVESQARIGRGWFRVVPEYADDDGFEQELKIKRIRNPQTVYADPAYQELDGRDMRYCYIVEDMPKDEYLQRFGKESLVSLEQLARVGERTNQWMPEGKVRIAECYQLEPTTKTIHRMEDGRVLTEKELDTAEVQAALVSQGISLKPAMTRTVESTKLTFALINGATILDGNEDKSGPREMPGKWIPVFPVVGEELDLDGTLDYRGLIRDAIDAQRMSNYWKSAMTEAVALAPKAPWIAEEGQIEDHEPEWQAANTRNIAVLKYKHVSIGGNTLVPPPQRVFGEPPIMAMSHLSLQSENDIRAMAGFSYDVGAHETRPESSGKAIIARQRQGEIGNSHYHAHLAVALRHCGRVLLNLIPQYYDTPRVKRILGRDGMSKAVLLHAGNEKDAQAEAQRQGLAEEKIHDLSVGRYDVRVTAGTSFASQRQEDRELMTYVLQTAPQLMQVIGDLYFGAMDSPVSRRIAKRLEKALPPQFQEQPEEGPQALPPQVQQQQQQASQMIEALTQQNNELLDTLNAKKAELDNKLQIAHIQAETQIAIAQSKAATDQGVALLEAKMQHLEAMVGLEGQRLKTDASVAQAERNQAGQRWQQQAQHSHELGMAQHRHASDAALGDQEAQTQQDLTQLEAELAPEPSAGTEE